MWKKALLFINLSLICLSSQPYYIPPISVKVWNSKTHILKIRKLGGDFYFLGEDGWIYQENGSNLKKKIQTKGAIDFLPSPQGFLLLKKNSLSFKNHEIPLSNPIGLFEIGGNPLILTKNSVFIFKDGKLASLYNGRIDSYLPEEDGLWISGPDGIFHCRFSCQREIPQAGDIIAWDGKRLLFKKKQDYYIWKKGAEAEKLPFKFKALLGAYAGKIEKYYSLGSQSIEYSLILYPPPFYSQNPRSLAIGNVPYEILTLKEGILILFENSGGLIIFPSLKKYYLPFPLSKISLQYLARQGDTLFFSGFSFWKSPIGEWKGAAALTFNLPWVEKAVKEDMKIAKKWKWEGKLFQSLKALEMALSMASYLRPSLQREIIANREALLEEIRKSRTLKRLFFNSLYLLGMIIAGFLVGMAVKMKYVRIFTNPPDEVLQSISGSHFTHSVIYRLKRIIQSENPQHELDQLRDKLKQDLEYFLKKTMGFYRYHPKWSRAKRAVKTTLRKVIAMKKYNPKTVAKALKAVEKLREEILNLRGSIVKDALAAAVSEMEAQALKKQITINTSLSNTNKGSFARLYPEELYQFKQAFLSLLQNSIEAFDNYSPPSPPTINVSAQENFDEIIIEIKDNGKGIDPQILPKIFADGFSYGKKGDPSQRGHGLTQVKALMEKWGKIKIKSAPGKGTTVRIEIKRSKEDTDEDMDS